MSNKISVVLFLCLIIWKENVIEASTVDLTNNKFAVHTNPFLKLLTFGDSVYYIGHTFRGNWYAAMLHCRSFNMDLVSIESKEENDFLFQSLKSVLGKSEGWTRLWTSGTSLPYNQWVWMATGNPVVYTNWYPGEPNNQTHQEVCIEVKYSQTEKSLVWNDIRSSADILALCEAKIDKPRL
ncbi:unnamed protein product [Diabrotica balteata]|uniref:C-type lectin domain-containing protein n=1 Tax=Diabrotica balteata TaxID=107213 RepID=A0A9N9XDB7_DIABA|nr:unnamed protein product [Diabrotica balteata]